MYYGALPDDDDFDPVPTGSDRDEITAVAPGDADFDLHPVWDGGDGITAALTDGAHADATESTIDGATATATTWKRKRNRRGGGLHTTKNRRKLSAHNATCGMPAAAADGVGCHGMTQEPGGGG